VGRLETFRALLGAVPLDVPLASTLISEWDDGGCRFCLIEYGTGDEERVQAYLLLPTRLVEGGVPGILAIHQEVTAGPTRLARASRLG
jgi:hypothetical protein